MVAIASGGGHWQQLMLLRPAFEGFEVHYATTLPGLADQSDASPASLVTDCNRNEKLAMLRSTMDVARLLLRVRPDVVVTTGALPGLIALALAKRVGARTAWIDSVANAEEMSMAGAKARPHADLWLSQWPEVARAYGASYAGSVL